MLPQLSAADLEDVQQLLQSYEAAQPARILNRSYL